MRMSGIPITGLAHSVSVVRRRDADDGHGGIVPGTADTIYEALQCRVATLTGEDELAFFGFASGQRWQVLSRYAPKIRRSDFIRIPWGMFPNIESEVAVGNGLAPTATITVPAGSVTINWDRENSRYVDSGEEYILRWDSGIERVTFEDGVESTILTFPATLLQSHNVFAFDWSSLNSDYAVASTSGDSKDYRILWLKHQVDDKGGAHHTSIYMELSEGD